MKYKGIEIKEFESEKPVLFDPPKLMLVWNHDSQCPKERIVYAFIPRSPMPAACYQYTWAHCAEIPEEISDLATVIQLAEWASKGFGIMKRVVSGDITTDVSFDEGSENRPVSDDILVRKWGDKEWHKPTREYLGLED